MRGSGRVRFTQRRIHTVGQEAAFVKGSFQASRHSLTRRRKRRRQSGDGASRIWAYTGMRHSRCIQRCAGLTPLWCRPKDLRHKPSVALMRRSLRKSMLGEHCAASPDTEPGPRACESASATRV